MLLISPSREVCSLTFDLENVSGRKVTIRSVHDKISVVIEQNRMHRSVTDTFSVKNV